MGLPCRPATAGIRRSRPGHPPPAFDAGQDGRLFAADEGAGALLDGDVEVGQAAQDVGAQQPGLAALGDGVLQALDGQRVLGPAVDVALGGADGVGGDEHALDHPEGVALQDGPVHERARVALVGVADEVLLGGRDVEGDLPLLPGGEARAAPAAQPGLDHQCRRPPRGVMVVSARAAAAKPPAASAASREAGSIMPQLSSTTRVCRAKNGVSATRGTSSKPAGAVAGAPRRSPRRRRVAPVQEAVLQLALDEDRVEELVRRSRG